MKSFIAERGLVAPMDRANVDTDLIIPKQFLKSIRRAGFGPYLFDSLRYLDEGQPGQREHEVGEGVARDVPGTQSHGLLDTLIPVVPIPSYK